MNFLHRFLQDHLHGAMASRSDEKASETSRVSSAGGDELKYCYADYASTVANANAMLLRHGPDSAQFTQADIASMRLFHRVKKMQGMGKTSQGLT